MTFSSDPAKERERERESFSHVHGGPKASFQFFSVRKQTFYAGQFSPRPDHRRRIYQQDRSAPKTHLKKKYIYIHISLIRYTSHNFSVVKLK